MPTSDRISDTAEEKGFPEKLEEYQQVEELIMTYQLQFKDNCSAEDIRTAQEAATSLLYRFTPLFKKYQKTIIHTKIDFSDKEVKRFVLSFIGDPRLKVALKKDVQSEKTQKEIRKKFNFVTETYGKNDPADIMTDLQMLFLTLAKRYKQMGRNFCAYLYNAYSYEVSRHIKKYIKNPGNISYKNTEYEDFMQSAERVAIEQNLEDRIYENNLGIPDMSWVQGISCSEVFQTLTPEERKIIIKYYAEDYNDRQIADEFGSHINTINMKRHRADGKLANALVLPESKIKRNRKSGKKALFLHHRS